MLEVASVAFADCSDNLAIFIPLLIKNNSAEKAITTITFLILIGVWCAVAYYLTHHKRIGSFIRYYGQILAPFILIGLGAVILFS
jgi:cadmium resistance protein CadD (predicted permease)